MQSDLINHLNKLDFVGTPMVTKLIDKVIISAKFTLNTDPAARLVVRTNRQIVTKATTLFRPTKPKRRKEQNDRFVWSTTWEPSTNYYIIIPKFLNKLLFVYLFVCCFRTTGASMHHSPWTRIVTSYICWVLNLRAHGSPQILVQYLAIWGLNFGKSPPVYIVLTSSGCLGWHCWLPFGKF